MIAQTSPYVSLVTWLHILVMDLFFGAWIVRDSKRVGISHLWVAPLVAVTFVAAPFGLLAYFGLRALLTRRLFLDPYLAEITSSGTD